MKFNSNLKIVIFITLLLLLLSISISLINFIVSLEAKEQELKERSLPLSVENIYTEVQRNVIEPNLISSMMAHDTFVKAWIHHQEGNDEKIQEYLSSIQKKYGMFLTFLVSEKTRSYYSQKGFIEKLSTDNPDNLWYFRFKDQGNDHEINLDYNDQFGNDMIMFINHKIYDTDNQLIGVTGIGLKMSYIDEILKLFREKYQFTVFFVDKSGDVVLKERSINSMQNLSDNPRMNAFKDKIFANQKQTLEYDDQGVHTLLRTQFIPELDAFLIVQANLGDFTRGVRRTFYINLSISLAITLVITLIILTMIRRFNQKLQYLARSDTLTDLKNRRAFDDDFEQFLSLSRRQNQPLSLIFFDIDNFKVINDEYGHHRGDLVIVRIADILRKNFRKEDLIARWGGEEFVISLLNTRQDQAFDLAEIFRKQIEQDAELQQLTSHPVTISVGVTQYAPPESYDSIFHRLDNAMYQAKQSGKNQSRLAEV